MVNANADVRDGVPRDAGALIGHADDRGVVSGAERDQLAAGFGRRIAELRALRRMTQAEAAKRARISQGFWSHLEHGRRRPSADLVALLALVLADPPRDHHRDVAAALDPTRDPWAIVDELLALGGTALSGGGRRRFRKETRSHLGALLQAPTIAAGQRAQAHRMRETADRFEALGAHETAESMRLAAETAEQLADAASACSPLTSGNALRGNDVSTRRGGGDAC
jgi:transcriptional regulator with XRE-family HTH domain